MVDLYESRYMDLLRRLFTSHVVCLGYHGRPPLPYHSDFDWLGMSRMSSEQQRSTIYSYETHGLDLTTGQPTIASGGYAKLASLAGYAAPSAEGGRAPFVAGIKMHDNDFLAEDSAWTTVYLAKGARQGPPWNTALKSAQPRADREQPRLAADGVIGEGNMRRTTWLIVMATVLGGFWLMQDILLAAARTRIFVTFVSHNEESISNPPCAPVMTDPVRFAANRTAVLSAAQVIDDKRATWDFQSEYEYLLRLIDWETAAERQRTQGLNLVHYLNTFAPGHIQVDAHSHEQRGYNYADVAYILAQLNVPPNGIVGGFIVAPAAQQTWTRLRQPFKGSRFPAYTWTATQIWGGGSAGHTDDSDASGIWRPRAANAFEQDDPAQTLLAVGNYPGLATAVDGESVAGLLTSLRAGRLQAGRMYTATIMIPQCELDSDLTLIPRIGLFIDRFQEDVAKGDLGATLTEMVRVWRVDYESAPLITHS